MRQQKKLTAVISWVAWMILGAVLWLSAGYLFWAVADWLGNGN